MISKSDLMDLRKQTGAGIMDCKEALEKNNGDLKEAVYYLRKKGLSKAAKKADRTTAEGLIAISLSDDNKSASMLSLNCETDFVSKNEEFVKFANELGLLSVENGEGDVEKFLLLSSDGEKVSDRLTSLIAKFGENIVINSLMNKKTSGSFASYLHFNKKIGVLVEFKGEVDEKIGKSIAMHIAAYSPSYLDHTEIEKDVLDREKDLFKSELASMNKPESVVEKIIEGKMKGLYKTMCLLDQEFIEDPKISVRDHLNKSGAEVVSFKRMSL